MGVRSLVSVCAFALLGCSTNVNVAPLSVPPDSVQPKRAEDVEVFDQVHQPTRPYMKHRDLSVAVQGAPQEMTAALREKAGAASCDAIVLLSEPGRADCIIYTSQ